ncbi:sigma-54-dependent Fis family transcriptional regulator [bacterium]|nr:sigma-54-dependent Fis family transcriptional regulator [bacterium]
MRILGKSKQVDQLRKLIERVAPSKSSVLIIGESGTGKELVARELHDQSDLKSKPFVPVNCGAIPETLIESELFGHKRGSFTGAVADKPGLFEAASGGTLFLDEIGEIPLSMQVKLLRALQERIIRRVGSNEDIKIDVRIVAATNRNLETAVKQGTFREDLYYRLNVILLETPPLRERKGDVSLLAEFFLKKFCKKFSKDIQSFDPEALAALEKHSWPGNVRELENVIERAVALEGGKTISLESLAGVLGEGSSMTRAEKAAAGVEFPDFSKGPVSLEAFLSRVEREIIQRALAQAKGSEDQAARLLQTSKNRIAASAGKTSR